MKKLFTYEGNIGSYGSDKLVELYADFSNTVAPILLHMPTGIYNYISKLGGTDHEERYLKSRYFYDSILYLRAIAVLNEDGKIAKVIVNNGYDDFENVTIFGPKDFIDDMNPSEISNNELAAFNNWKLSENW